jgi:hypothetical protein
VRARRLPNPLPHCRTVGGGVGDVKPGRCCRVRPDVLRRVLRRPDHATMRPVSLLDMHMASSWRWSCAPVRPFGLG